MRRILLALALALGTLGTTAAVSAAAPDDQSISVTRTRATYHGWDGSISVSRVTRTYSYDPIYNGLSYYGTSYPTWSYGYSCGYYYC